MPVVVLSRSDVSTPWGFRLHGGKDFGSPLTVQRVGTQQLLFLKSWNNMTNIKLTG